MSFLNSMEANWAIRQEPESEEKMYTEQFLQLIGKKPSDQDLQKFQQHKDFIQTLGYPFKILAISHKQANRLGPRDLGIQFNRSMPISRGLSVLAVDLSCTTLLLSLDKVFITKIYRDFAKLYREPKIIYLKVFKSFAKATSLANIDGGIVFVVVIVWFVLLSFESQYIKSFRQAQDLNSTTVGDFSVLMIVALILVLTFTKYYVTHIKYFATPRKKNAQQKLG